MAGEIETGKDLSVVVINLLKGVIYRDDNPVLWNKLLNIQAAVRDYTGVIGLRLEINEEEGFSWLRNAGGDEEAEELPSLTVRRQLSYPVSLLLALLRRRLAEHDASSGESRLILSREDIAEMMKTYMPSGSNEARITDQIDSYINKAIELGFIRRLKSADSKLEIRRILKAFINAERLHEFEEKLNEYIRSGSLKHDGPEAAE